MVSKAEEAKQKIAQQKAKLEFKERLLKEKERKAKTRKLIQVGSLIFDAEIDDLNPDTLFGALLEIKEKATDQKTLETWTKKGEQVLQNKELNSSIPLIISFEIEPNDEMKKKLKQLSFKWNHFRKEWYGYGNKFEIEELLKPFSAKIEVVNS